MKFSPFQLFKSLRTQLALFGIAVATVTCGILGWTAYQKSREIIVSNAKRTVGIVATARKEALVRILKNYTERAGSLLTSAGEACRHRPVSCVRDRLVQFAKANGAESAFVLFYGKQAYVGDHGKLLANNRQATWLPGQIAQFELGHDSESYFVIRAEDNTSEKQLLVRFSSEKIHGLFQDRTGLGESGETFLTDSQGMFLTRSRYPSHSGHSHPITARPMANCLSGAEEEVLDPDYRNVGVIHGFRFVPEIGGGCVMAHIDQAEAFAPAKALQSFATFLALSVGILAVLVSWILSHFMVRPIRVLTARAVALKEGDLDSPIPRGGSSEIDTFAESFEAMRRSLKESQEQLFRRKKKFRAIFEGSHDAILIFDPRKNQILDANPSACRLLNYELSELLRTPVSHIHPTDMPRLLNFVSTVAQEGRGWTDELTCTSNDGLCIYCEISASVIEINNEGQILAIVRDVSARKAAETKIKEQAEKLARSNADLERFASVAAHDLQEPLRTVAMFCSLLHGKSEGKLDDECQEYMKFVADGAKRMQRLVQDLLAYARIEASAKTPEPIRFSWVFEQAMTSLKGSIAECGAEITCDNLAVSVAGNPTLLAQMLQNLLGNAIKYRRPGVPPKIEVSATRDGDLWRFKIRDNGIGIPKEHLNRVFEIFQRLHSRQEYDGTGIGLATCRKIVERHGGSIWAESEPGSGSSFYFTLRSAIVVKNAPEHSKDPSHSAREVSVNADTLS